MAVNSWVYTSPAWIYIPQTLHFLTIKLIKLKSPPQILELKGCKGYFIRFFNTAENLIHV